MYKNRLVPFRWAQWHSVFRLQQQCSPPACWSRNIGCIVFWPRCHSCSDRHSFLPITNSLIGELADDGVASPEFSSNHGRLTAKRQADLFAAGEVVMG